MSALDYDADAEKAKQEKLDFYRPFIADMLAAVGASYLRTGKMGDLYKEMSQSGFSGNGIILVERIINAMRKTHKDLEPETMGIFPVPPIQAKEFRELLDERLESYIDAQPDSFMKVGEKKTESSHILEPGLR